MVGVRCAVFNHVCARSFVRNFLCSAFLYLKTDFTAFGKDACLKSTAYCIVGGGCGRFFRRVVVFLF